MQLESHIAAGEGGLVDLHRDGVGAFHQDAAEVEIAGGEASFVSGGGQGGGFNCPGRHARRAEDLGLIDVDHCSVVDKVVNEPPCFTKLLGGDLEGVAEEIGGDEVLAIEGSIDAEEEIRCPGKAIDPSCLEGSILGFPGTNG